MKIQDWIEQLKQQFEKRDLEYMTVHKACITLQLKDKETGNIHLHKLDYTSKAAENFEIIA